MGTRERKQRHMAEREQLFVDAAFALIHEEGLLNLQMSRVAEKCEYAVGTLYQHFASKEDLLLALVTENTRKHVHLFERIADWKACPRDRMMAVGVADMIFVQRNPDHFRLAQYALCEVVWQAASPARREELLALSDPVGDIVLGIVEEAAASGDLDLHGKPPAELATGLWALCLGFHNLVHADGMLRDFGVDHPYLVMCRQSQYLLNGYGWKPLFDPADDRALDELIKRICTEVFDGIICSQ